MNPVTRALLERLGEHPIESLVADWDALEALVIRVYKTETASTADEREYGVLRRRLSESYARWRDKLTPFWQEKAVGGVPAETDPFLSLISPKAAHEFIGDWAAMQTLPAARQALNEYLVDLLDHESGAKQI